MNACGDEHLFFAGVIVTITIYLVPSEKAELSFNWTHICWQDNIFTSCLLVDIWCLPLPSLPSRLFLETAPSSWSRSPSSAPGKSRTGHCLLLVLCSPDRDTEDSRAQGHHPVTFICRLRRKMVFLLQTHEMIKTCIFLRSDVTVPWDPEECCGH